MIKTIKSRINLTDKAKQLTNADGLKFLQMWVPKEAVTAIYIEKGYSNHFRAVIGEQAISLPFKQTTCIATFFGNAQYLQDYNHQRHTFQRNPQEATIIEIL